MSLRSNVLLRIVALLLPTFLWIATAVQPAWATAFQPDCAGVCDPQETQQPNNRVYLPVIATVGQPTLQHSLVTPLPGWSEEWWQWVERTNGEPVFLEGNVDCSIGQGGTRWFLAGSVSSVPITRNCSVPSANTLLIPLFTSVYFNDPSESLTIEEKQQFLDSVYSDTEPGPVNSQICHLSGVIDGTSVDAVRLQSGPFIFQGDFEAIQDGFWIAFQLSPGRHQLHFHGSLCEFETDNEINNDQLKPVDVTYNLTATQ